MTTRNVLTASALALVGLGGLATATATDILPLSATETTTVSAGAMGCNDWPSQLTQKECFAAGVILTGFQNLQPAVQFCKWKAANPGEWSRLKTYAATGGTTPPSQIVTWFGSSIRDDLLAYAVIGAPGFALELTNPPPNACTGKLVKPPIVLGVTPGETDATVTVTTTP